MSSKVKQSGVTGLGQTKSRPGKLLEDQEGKGCVFVCVRVCMPMSQHMYEVQRTVSWV